MTTNSIIKAIIKEWEDWGDIVAEVADDNGYTAGSKKEHYPMLKHDFIHDRVWAYCGNEPRAKQIKEELNKRLEF